MSSLLTMKYITEVFLIELATSWPPFNPSFRTTTPLEGFSHVDLPISQFNAYKFLENLFARNKGKFLLKRMTSNWHNLYS